MSEEYDADATAETENNRVNRRRFVRSLGAAGGAVVASGMGIGQVTAQSENSEEPNVVTKKQEVTAKDARQYASKIPKDLTDSLSKDDLVRDRQNNIEHHQMSDDRLRGGIEKYQIKYSDGVLHENVLIHKETPDGGHLTLMMPVDDREPKAIYKPKDESKTVRYDASGRRQVEEEEPVTTLGGCHTRRCYKWCHACAACCPDVHVLRPCPGCWIPGECKVIDERCNAPFCRGKCSGAT